MMMTAEEARHAAFKLEAALHFTNGTGELPFANMQRQLEKVQSQLGQMAIELRMYAQRQEEHYEGTC